MDGAIKIVAEMITKLATGNVRRLEHEDKEYRIVAYTMGENMIRVDIKKK